jgi:1-acyl-sn-glycerol-3-phosphate acyltransferase
MSRRISGVSITGLDFDVPRDRPIICVANHTSWWDGFLLMEIRHKLRPNAPFHSVMLASQLRKAPFLRQIGAIGIDPSSPQSVLSVKTELQARLKDRPDSFVFYFPQGRIWPSRRRPLGFKRGIELFIEWLGDATVLPVGIHIEPLNRASPRAFLSVGKPIDSDLRPAAGDLERAVEMELDRILEFLDHHGEDAASEWPHVNSRLFARAQ